MMALGRRWSLWFRNKKKMISDACQIANPRAESARPLPRGAIASASRVGRQDGDLIWQPVSFMLTYSTSFTSELENATPEEYQSLAYMPQSSHTIDMYYKSTDRGPE